MQVGDTLRTKRTELKGRLAAIVAEAAEIQAQVVAIDRVIAIYEPEYVPDADAPLALPRPVRKRQPQQRVLPEVNKRQAVQGTSMVNGRVMPQMVRTPVTRACCYRPRGAHLSAANRQA
jgi:hypothetical protein